VRQGRKRTTDERISENDKFFIGKNAVQLLLK